MPVDAYIFATSGGSVLEPTLRALNAHFAREFRADTFHDEPDALAQVPPAEYDFLPDHLPRAACVLQVRLMGAYYGPGYERGWWPEIAAVLEFLRRQLPNSQVWYGRDDGDWVREVTAESLDALWDHWAKHGGRPYYEGRPGVGG